MRIGTFVHISLGGLTLVAACAGWVACTPREDLEPVGTTTDPHVQPAERPKGGHEPGDPGLPADWKTRFAHSPDVTSRGHGTGHWPMTVYASDEAALAAATHGHAAPEGAILVAVHPPLARARHRSSEPDPPPSTATSVTPRNVLFIMQKNGGDGGAPGPTWSYRVDDENGDVTREPPECASCHADAPSDQLFVLPQTAQANALGADAGR